MVDAHVVCGGELGIRHVRMGSGAVGWNEVQNEAEKRFGIANTRMLRVGVLNVDGAEPAICVTPYGNSRTLFQDGECFCLSDLGEIVGSFVRENGVPEGSVDLIPTQDRKILLRVSSQKKK